MSSRDFTSICNSGVASSMHHTQFSIRSPRVLPADTAKAVSRSYTYKKVTKPLLERKRRARISKCVDELKALLVGPMRISEENLNRLEKADILELAVTYLNSLHLASHPNRYQEGFNECAAEACHFLETSEEFEEGLSERLVEHLETCTGPLSIEVPQFKLTFSPPVSPVSLNHSPQPLTHLTTLHDLAISSPGLLMEAGTKRFSPYPMKTARKTGSKGYNSVSSFSNKNHTLAFRTPLSERQEKDSMWRPW